MPVRHRRGTARSIRKELRLVAVTAVAVLVLAGCLRNDTGYLISDDLGGRDNGSAGSVLAQDFLIDRMQGWTVGANSSATGVQAYHQDFTGGRNIVAIIPGTDLADEYVMIGAHYDGHGSGPGCRGKTAADDICNGATDNAVGVGIVLQAARRLTTWPPEYRPRRSVIVAFWDGEEDGLLGSRAYVAHPLVPLADTVAYVNLDIQGSNLRKSIASTTFAIGAETGGPFLEDAVTDAAAPGPLETRQLSLLFGMGRSDHAVLANAGVPVVFFSDSTGPCYHTIGDDASAVDWVKAEAQLTTVHRLLVDLTRNDDVPSPVAGTPLVSFDDALSLAEVLADLRTGTGEFTPQGEATLAARGATLDQVVAAGPDAFDSTAQNSIVAGAYDLVNLLTTGACDAFLPDR